MRIESALYASSQGLNAHGQALSVIGDNVSNANTTGFKSSNVQFSDLLAEGPERASSTANEPVGNGVTVSAINQNFSTGVIEFTGRELDTAIDGDGFFIVGSPENVSYTRNGTLVIDGNGFLSTSNGANVLGFSGDGGTLAPIDMANFDIGGTASSNIRVSGNLNSTSGITTVPNAPQTFDEIGALASFSSQVTAFDSLGVGRPVTLAYFKTAPNTWTAQAYIDSAEVGGTAGIPAQVGANATLTFTPAGLIDEANAAAAVITGTPAYSSGAEAGNFTIDLSNFSQFGGTSYVDTIDQDGVGTGDIAGYEIRANGNIVALLTGGIEIDVGTIALANFNNLEGLQRSGAGLFLETERSGQAIVGTAGTTGFGEIRGSSLELSNVDIANEFVDLVIFQRGYQASSQIFSTTSEILRDTIALIR